MWVVLSSCLFGYLNVPKYGHCCWMITSNSVSGSVPTWSRFGMEWPLFLGVLSGLLSCHQTRRIKFDKIFFPLFGVGSAICYTENRKPSTVTYLGKCEKATQYLLYGFNSANETKTVGKLIKPATNYKDDYISHGFCIDFMYTGSFCLFQLNSTCYVIFIQ